MLMDQVAIGLRIKKIRIQQRRTQQDIADFCGFTKSHLSKIEKGKVMPSIGVLAKIANSLSIKISILLDEEHHETITHDAEDRIADNLITTANGYSIYPFAASQEDKNMQPFFFVTRKDEHRLHTTTHDGDEFLYILEGEMLLRIGAQEYHLKAGDGLYFNGQEEHQTVPLTDVVKVIDIIST